MVELAEKQQDIANLINGEVIDDTDRVAVCIKGKVNGFPATLEAFMTGWPFNCTYVVESVLERDPDRHPEDGAKISVLPRMGQGLWGIFTHIFLFEGKGMSVNDRRLEKKLIFNYDLRDPALRLIKYPGIAETLMVLEEDCKLKELILKTNAGLYMIQGCSFDSLDLDLCSATFNYMAQVAQVINELFE